MTKLIKIKHPKQGQTYKSLALRMANGALHTQIGRKYIRVVRFRTQTEAVKYAHQHFSSQMQPTITVLR